MKECKNTGEKLDDTSLNFWEHSFVGKLQRKHQRDDKFAAACHSLCILQVPCLPATSAGMLQPAGSFYHSRGWGTFLQEEASYCSTAGECMQGVNNSGDGDLQGGGIIILLSTPPLPSLITKLGTERERPNSMNSA